VEQDLIHDLAAAYALDALDDDERREFEDHLQDCERCRSSLAELRDAAAALAYVAEGPAPPPVLRERLLERVHAERPANVVPLRRRAALPAVAAVAAVAACAAIAFGVWASSLSDSLDRKEAALGIVGNPAATHVKLGSAGQVVVAPSGDAALVSRLSPAPKGKTYEIWVIEEGAAPKPAGLFTVGKSGKPVLLSQRVPRGAQVGLSLERSGGAPKPTVILSVSRTV
jgi:anti-sigma-K factor RskA